MTARVRRGVVLDSLTILISPSRPSVGDRLPARRHRLHLLMRGVEWVERVRSEAVFDLQSPYLSGRCRSTAAFSAGRISCGWTSAASSSGKAAAHHYLRLIYDILRRRVSRSPCWCSPSSDPRRPIAISRSDDAIALSLSRRVGVRCWPSSPFAAAAAILVFAPAVDAAIDRALLLSPRPPLPLQYQVSRWPTPGRGAVSSAQTERHRIERDLHDASSPGWSRWHDDRLGADKLDNDLPAARKLITEAQDDAKSRAGRVAQFVVRGMAPTILADRGLDVPLSSVRSAPNLGVPTTLNIYLAVSMPDEVNGRLLRRRRAADQRRQARARHPGGGDCAVRRAGKMHCTSRCSTTGVGGADVSDGEDATGLRGLDERAARRPAAHSR